MKMMVKWGKKILFLSALLSTPLWLWAAPTQICADSSRTCTFGALYQNISSASYSGIQIIYMVSMLLGISGTVFGLLKLRQHGTDSQGSSGALRQAIYSLVISALLVCVPVIALLVTGTFLGETDIPMVPENTIQNYGQSSLPN